MGNQQVSCKERMASHSTMVISNTFGMELSKVIYRYISSRSSNDESCITSHMSISMENNSRVHNVELEVHILVLVEAEVVEVL